MTVKQISETELVQRIMNARAKTAYIEIDTYLKAYPDDITNSVRAALSGYETFRELYTNKSRKRVLNET